ncbi:uncharacterized protein LOC143286936 [Babylonia areolata]|uniref:uncharacterized protein LOC143286936 n=1 Tax=Babylonia areolata TaxID=304850 RepID=UPI003FD3CA56
MPVLTTTGFSVIDTYNIIREDMQASESDFDEEEFDRLHQQQEIPQFFSSSSSSSSSSITTTTTTTTTQQQQQTTVPSNNNNNNVQHRLSPSPYLSPCHSPAPSSYTTSHSPCPPSSPYSSSASSPCPPPHTPQPMHSEGVVAGAPLPVAEETSSSSSSSSSVQQQLLLSEQQIQSFLDMDMMSATSFLEELMGPSPPSPSQVVLPLPLPTTTTPPPPPPPPHVTTHTTTTTYLGAAAGCTTVSRQVRTPTSTSSPSSTDQRLVDADVLDVSDLCDLDRPSFYDDGLLEGVKAKAVPSDWMGVGGELGAGLEEEVKPVMLHQQHQLTELGPVVGSEQEDLLSVFDSIRSDILHDCKQLSISPNPKAWSAQDSGTWVSYMLDRFQRPDDCSAALSLPGAELCRMGEAELVLLSPASGTFLLQQLQLWLAVADLPMPTPKPQQQQQQQQQSLVVGLTGADVQLSPQSGATTMGIACSQRHSVSPAPSNDSLSSSQSLSSSSLSSSSLSSPSEAEMFWFASAESSEEEMSQDSDSSLTPTEQPRTTPSSKSSSTSRPRPGRPGKQIRLWEFLKELLEDGDPSMKWLDQSRGIFKIEDSNRVARLWGSRKNHPAMNYDKLSRSVRQYYKKGIIKKTAQSRRLVYQFCERYL